MESEVSTGETETPTTDRPFASRSRCRALNSGISARQGRHQVAQKFSNTTRPRNDESRIGFPSRASNWTSGAGANVELPGAGVAGVTGATFTNHPSKFGNKAATLELASKLEYPVAISNPMVIKTTPDTTSTLC